MFYNSYKVLHYRKKYMKEVTTDQNWNKLRFNWRNVLREPSIMWLFVKNQYYAMLDVGLHVKGKIAQIRCKLAWVFDKIGHCGPNMV